MMEELQLRPRKLTAYELLCSEPRPMPIFSKYFSHFYGVAFGLTTALAFNFLSKRPLLSGIQNYVGLGIGGFVLAKFADDYRNNNLARRDAVLRHYMELHPEDFPEPEKKKFKDVLTPWTPVR